jgi:hypothetical protein
LTLAKGHQFSCASHQDEDLKPARCDSKRPEPSGISPDLLEISRRVGVLKGRQKVVITQLWSLRQRTHL